MESSTSKEKNIQQMSNSITPIDKGLVNAISNNDNIDFENISNMSLFQNQNKLIITIGSVKKINQIRM